jgi:hypothetical protein
MVIHIIKVTIKKMRAIEGSLLEQVGYFKVILRAEKFGLVYIWRLEIN